MVELNKVYCIDNLELLKQLPDNYIDLIYCDILYGTGRNFGDYQDLKCDKKIIEEHYIPRIKEMYRVLKDTGSIYLQMDTRINHWIRCLMDDIFGYNNFLNEISWCYNTAGSISKIKYKNNHDIIIFYHKKQSKFNKLTFLKKIDNNYSGHFKDDNGWYLLTGVGEYSIESINKLEKEGRIHRNKKDNKPSLKRYLININNTLYKEKIISDVWDDLKTFGSINNDIRKQKVDYPSQKPKALLERIIKASSNEGDIVADFYMGSGTSMVVAKELHRQFIGCDISQKAVDITNKRLKNVMKINKLF